MEITTRTIEQYQGYTLTLHATESGRTKWELLDENFGATNVSLTLNRDYDFDNDTTITTVQVFARSGGAMNMTDAANYADEIMKASQVARYLNGVIELTEAKN